MHSVYKPQHNNREDKQSDTLNRQNTLKQTNNLFQVKKKINIVNRKAKIEIFSFEKFHSKPSNRNDIKRWDSTVLQIGHTFSCNYIEILFFH